MTQKIVTTFTLLIFLLLAFLALWLLMGYYGSLPDRVSQHETLVLGQNKLSPGSQAALRVLVRDSKDAAPLPGSEIAVSLRSPQGKETEVYRGITDDNGTANVSFHVPQDAKGSQTLLVSTKSRLGSDRIERPVTIERDFRIYMTTESRSTSPGS
jgi:hypothetical protein